MCYSCPRSRRYPTSSLEDQRPRSNHLLNANTCIGGGDDATRAPPHWRLSKIVSIPKKGNSTSLDMKRLFKHRSHSIYLLILYVHVHRPQKSK